MSHSHRNNFGKTLTIFLSLILVSIAIPTSVLEDLLTKDVTNKKVKRAQILSTIPEKSTSGHQKEYLYPTAHKRGGGNMKTNQLPLLTEWDQQRYREQMEGLPPSLYSPLDDLDDKSISEYEKGYRYALNRDKLNEARENAILKSELYGYGEPTGVNQYRYYGIDDMKRKRRSVGTDAAAGVARAQKARRITKRLKRQADLSPEEILAILTLWENERLNNQNPHRPWQNYDEAISSSSNDFDNDSDEDWLDSPVYPHASDDHMTPPSANYYYDVNPRPRPHAQPPSSYYNEKRGRWGGFSETNRRNKRFMVAKKRTDPTRELRYLNGPSRNDYYALSELLANQQRDPDVPLYQRYML